MSTSTSSPTPHPPRDSRASLWRWRVVDIVVASVIAVACSLVFLLWNVGYEAPSALLEAAAARVCRACSPGRGSSPACSAASSSASRAPRSTPSSSPPSSRRSSATSGGPSRSSRDSSRDSAPSSSSCSSRTRCWRLPVAILAGAGAGLACGINDRILWYAGRRHDLHDRLHRLHDDLGRRDRRRRVVVRRARARGHRGAQPVRLGPRSRAARLA